MPGHAENLHRENVPQNRPCRHARFLVRFFECHGKQLRLAVRVPAEPGPGIVNIVVREKDLRLVGIYDPA